MKNDRLASAFSYPTPKTLGTLPILTGYRKVIWLALERASEHWSQPIKDWPSALNHFSIVFEGRVPA